MQQQPLHSITSSARVSSGGRTVRPIACQPAERRLNFSFRHIPVTDAVDG
jgi:hypothetical protein